MIDALVAGKIRGNACQKIGKTQKPYVTARMTAHAGDGDLFVNVITFTESVQAALLALGDGESVALSGSLKASVWTDKNGNPHPSLDLVATAIVTPFHVTRKRRAMEEAQKPERPSHDAWIART